MNTRENSTRFSGESHGVHLVAIIDECGGMGGANDVMDPAVNDWPGGCFGGAWRPF